MVMWAFLFIHSHEYCKCVICIPTSKVNSKSIRDHLVKKVLETAENEILFQVNLVFIFLLKQKKKCSKLTLRTVVCRIYSTFFSSIICANAFTNIHNAPVYGEYITQIHRTNEWMREEKKKRVKRQNKKN